MNDPMEKLRAAGLTPRQVRCLAAYYFDGRSQAEVAEYLDMAQPTVCRHIRSARRRLRKAGLVVQRPQTLVPPVIQLMPPAQMDELSGREVRGRW